jgi:CheY-like chemotaxis protein
LDKEALVYIGWLCRHQAQGARSRLSSFLGREFTPSFLVADSIDAGALPDPFQGSVFGGKVSFGGEVSGEGRVLLPVPDAIALAGCVLKWDGPEVERRAKEGALDGEVIEAAQGVLKGWVEAASGRYTKVLGVRVEASLEEVSTHNLSGGSALLQGDWVGVQTGLKLEGLPDGKLLQCFASPLAQALADRAKAKVSLEEAGKEIAPEEESEGKGARVLTVDDAPLIRRLIRAALSGKGYEVHEAGGGEEALRFVRKQPVDLILLDIMMPKMDGLETCQRLRRTEEAREIPIIMCSAKGQKKDILGAIKCGANDYVVKPFDREVLLSKIRKALSRRGSRAPASGDGTAG